MDEVFFVCIACLVRHEFNEHPDKYTPNSALLGFLDDMENWGWDSSAQGSVDMLRYCGKMEGVEAFLQCLCEIRASLENFGEFLPEDYANEIFRKKGSLFIQACPVRKIRHWLDQLCIVIREYNDSKMFRQLPYPP